MNLLNMQQPLLQLHRNESRETSGVLEGVALVVAYGGGEVHTIRVGSCHFGDRLFGKCLTCLCFSIVSLLDIPCYMKVGEAGYIQNQSWQCP